ncbi:MAG: DinB family protein [Ignavibacteria bacterium]
MTAKEILLEQLSATHNQKNWFVPFSDSVAGLQAGDAAWKDSSGNHSVWGIVNHLIFWNGRWLTRLNGEVPAKIEIENSGTFTDGKADEEAWKASVSKLDEIMTEIELRLKDITDETLDKEAFPGYGGSWYEMFTQMTIHNAYHIGQIVHLRKQHGLWDPKQGVS